MAGDNLNCLMQFTDLKFVVPLSDFSPSFDNLLNGVPRRQPSKVIGHIGGLTFPNDLLMQSKGPIVLLTPEFDKECGLSLNDRKHLLGHFSMDFPDINACYNPGNQFQVAVLTSKPCLLQITYLSKTQVTALDYLNSLQK